MSKPNYRVTLTFDPERKLFMARAPELEHCAGEGATRGEAIAKLEEEIDAQLANMLSHGATPPRSVDEESYSGQLTVKVSRSLHRELAYQARSEGIDLDQIVSELVAGALEGRKQGGRVRSGNRAEHDGNRGNGGPGGRQGGYRNNGAQLMDDRATFIEYVRNLEQAGGHGRPHMGGQGGGGGQHGMPGGGGRRRRGGGGGGGRGPGGGFRGDRPAHGGQGGHGHGGHGHGGHGGHGASGGGERHHGQHAGGQHNGPGGPGGGDGED